MARVKLPFRRTRFTNLTDSQWQVIKELVDDGRKRKTCLRTIVNAILKLDRTGCQWRNMDEKWPPWQTVYYYFRKWKRNGTWALILMQLVVNERLASGRRTSPSACAIDSQSVKKGPLVSVETGVDGGKLVNGRKRHLVVDALGLPIAAHVSAANVHDGKAGIELLWQIDEFSAEMKLVRGDHAYGGEFRECAAIYKWEVETTQRPETTKGFVPQMGRWQVERSFAWLNYFRRLSKDYEKTPESALAFVQIAFIDIILSRIRD